jgi:hypothetical protein
LGIFLLLEKIVVYARAPESSIGEDVHASALRAGFPPRQLATLFTRGKLPNSNALFEATKRSPRGFLIHPMGLFMIS